MGDGRGEEVFDSRFKRNRVVAGTFGLVMAERGIGWGTIARDVCICIWGICM